MSILIVIVLTFFIFWLAVFLVGLTECWSLFLLIPVLALCGWLAVFSFQPWSVEREEIYKPTKVDNVQLVIVSDKPINVNKEFGRIVGEDEKVKRIIYKNGPYVGLYTLGTTDKYEIVK